MALILLHLGTGVVSAFLVDAGDDRDAAAPSAIQGFEDEDDAGLVGPTSTTAAPSATSVPGAAGVPAGSSGGSGTTPGGTSGGRGTTSGGASGGGSGSGGSSGSAGGSGLGASGTGAVANGTSPVPETGGESLLLPGTALLVAAGAARRFRRR